MKEVYLVIAEDYTGDDSWVRGVYSTQALAEESLKDFSVDTWANKGKPLYWVEIKDYSKIYYRVDVWDVDGEF